MLNCGGFEILVLFAFSRIFQKPPGGTWGYTHFSGFADELPGGRAGTARHWTVVTIFFWFWLVC